MRPVISVATRLYTQVISVVFSDMCADTDQIKALAEMGQLLTSCVAGTGAQGWARGAVRVSCLHVLSGGPGGRCVCVCERVY